MAPYHPSSNGLAERAVQTFKRGLKATKGDSLQECLSKFLFTYPITPHTTTSLAPAQLLMNCRLRSRFDHLFPDLPHHVQKKQAKQAASHDNSKPLRSFTVGDLVYTKDFSSSPLMWIPGTIVRITGPLSYHVELCDGRVIRRHVNAVCTRHVITDSSPLRDSALPQEHLYFPTRATPTVPFPPQPPLVRRSTRSRSRPNYYGH